MRDIIDVAVVIYLGCYLGIAVKSTKVIYELTRRIRVGTYSSYQKTEFMKMRGIIYIVMAILGYISLAILITNQRMNHLLGKFITTYVYMLYFGILCLILCVGCIDIYFSRDTKKILDSLQEGEEFDMQNKLKKDGKFKLKDKQ